MTEEQEKRIDAMKWWNRMNLLYKFECVIKWLKSQGRDTTERHPDTLTGREIQEIFEMTLNEKP
jgi:hypothetical protein